MTETKHNERTPQFLIWAIHESCEIKSTFECCDEDSVDLMQLERTLRPLRCLAEASAENRIQEDVCLQMPRETKPKSLPEIKGFSIEEVLNGFGGEDFLKDQCSNCPANVFDPLTSNVKNRQFGGCYGILQAVYGDFPLFEFFRKQLSEPLDILWRTESLDDGLFLNPPRVQQLNKLLQLAKNEFQHADLVSLLAATEYSLASNKRIQVQVIPESQIVGRNWIVPQHCSNCIIPLDVWKGQCPHCQTKSPPNPMRKRLLRGDRPYWPLVKFLGEDATAKLAHDYFM